MELIPEAKPRIGVTLLSKMPSLDFAKALQASTQHNLDHVKRDRTRGDMYGCHHDFHNYLGDDQSHETPGHRYHASPNGHSTGFRHVADHVDGQHE